MPRYAGSDDTQANEQKRKNGRLGQTAQRTEVQAEQTGMKGMARQTHQSEMAEAESVSGNTKLNAMPAAKHNREGPRKPRILTREHPQ